MTEILDREAFIRAQTLLLPVPHAPEIALYLADEATELWQKTEDELGEIGLPPPFWAFAWAGGQALARYLLDHPEIGGGPDVLDFASGSGLVAIAAMKSGASLRARGRHRPILRAPPSSSTRGERRDVHAALEDLIGHTGRSTSSGLAGDSSTSATP